MITDDEKHEIVEKAFDTIGGMMIDLGDMDLILNAVIDLTEEFVWKKEEYGKREWNRLRRFLLPGSVDGPLSEGDF